MNKKYKNKIKDLNVMKNIKIPKNFFSFLWYIVKNYKYVIIIYVFLSLIAGLWGPLNSVITKKIIDNLSNNKSDIDFSSIFSLSILIVINFIVFENFTWRGIGYIKYKYLPILSNKVDNSLLNYILQHSFRFFSDNMSGAISRQIFSIVEGFEKTISNTIPNLLRGFSLIIFALIFSYSVNSIFCIILFIWVIFFTLISIIMSKKLSILSEKQAEKENILGGQIIDSITNFSNVILFSRRKHEINIRKPAQLEYINASRKNTKYEIIMHSIQGGMIAIMMGLSIFFLVYLYNKKNITIGDFALIIGLSIETGHMTWWTASIIDELNKTLGKCNSALNKLIIPIEIIDKKNAKNLNLKNKNTEIIFDKVTFAYKDNLNPIFKNQSIHIKSGEKIGLVGYSGSGKTTFVNLLLRLYDIKSGNIYIGGQNIQEITQNSLRKNIAMIPQEPILFHRSIKENIRYGNILATDEEILYAAKRANAHDFINQLPQKYETLVGERGVKLSGGQKQRIAIARAILKNANIIIFDEATSQLDLITENDIQQSIWEISKDKTTIIIAHRISTLKKVNRIIVFDNGVIVGEGGHEELILKDGLYKKLWDRQILLK